MRLGESSSALRHANSCRRDCTSAQAHRAWCHVCGRGRAMSPARAGARAARRKAAACARRSAYLRPGDRAGCCRRRFPCPQGPLAEGERPCLARTSCVVSCCVWRQRTKREQQCVRSRCEGSVCGRGQDGVRETAHVSASTVRTRRARACACLSGAADGVVSALSLPSCSASTHLPSLCFF